MIRGFTYSIIVCFVVTVLHHDNSISGVPNPVNSGTINLSLEEAIDMALKNNLLYKSAAYSYDAQKAQFYQEISPENTELFVEHEGLPELTASASGYKEKRIGIAQNFDFPVKWYLKGKSVREEIKSSEMDFRMVRLDLIEKVRNGYYKVLLKGQMKKYEEENLVLLKDFLKKAELKYKLGESPNIDVLRARVEVSRGETNKLIAENEYEIARVNLHYILNLDGDKTITLDDKLDYKPLSLDLEELKKVALQKHPEIRSAEYLCSSAKTRKNLAWSGFLPDWYVGFFKMKFANPAEPDKWGTAAGINLPVWFFLRQAGEIKQSKAEMKAAKINLENLKKEILVSVEKNYRELKAFEKNVLTFDEAVLKEAEEVYRIAGMSYSEGQAGYIELLEAQRTLTATRKEYVMLLYDYQAALSALLKSVNNEIVFN